MTSILDISPVVPIVVLHDAEHAVPLALALAAGGVRIVEVTLRTDAALPAIERIAAEVPDVVVGAGTITAPGHVSDAVKAGAQFLVSPGSTPAVLDAMSDCGLPFLPGVATASEVMTLLERGHHELKFFPAEAAGGRAYLNALAGPLPQARFCPTGGIAPEAVPDYLALANVACVGGSWLAPADALENGDWRRIEQLAAQAMSLD